MSFKNIGHKIEIAVHDPGLIIPFFEKKIKDFILKPKIKRLLDKHEAEYIASGTTKEVYKITQHFKNNESFDYVVAFLSKPIRCKDDINTCLKKMRETRSWYKNVFGKDFVNDEKLFLSQNNSEIIIYIQPWIDFNEDKKDLFYNIPDNIDNILLEISKNEIFKEKLKNIANKIISTYEECGVLPDLFNSMSVKNHNPANLYAVGDSVVFIDTHLIYHDSRIKYNKEKYNNVIIKEMNDKNRLNYVDRLIDAFKIIRDF